MDAPDTCHGVCAVLQLHDKLQGIVRSAFGTVLPEIAEDAAKVGRDIRIALSTGTGAAVSREQFVERLLTSLLGSFDMRFLLAQLQGVMGQR